MSKIQLLYVQNTLLRKRKSLVQSLTFYLQLQSVDYQKQVAVIWAGDDGVWHTLNANFHHRLEDKEFWHVQVDFEAESREQLPGNIQFALHYRVAGQDYWDNNQGANYYSASNSGVQLSPFIQVLNIGFTEQLPEQTVLPISVAVAAGLQPRKVIVHWTTDNWQHIRRTACQRRRQTLTGHPQSAELWSVNLKVEDAYSVQYCIVCDTGEQQYWDNHYGKNYQSKHRPLKILILNLHCYQETEQDRKLTTIAQAIDENAVDIVCFQEVAEFWNNGFGDSSSNTARIINDRLAAPYHLYTDWSHLGFDKYREGVAILSRYPLQKQESRYVSSNRDIYSIHSRKVVMARIAVPGMGQINVFSAHLSWWEDGFAEQFQNLSAWAAALHTPGISATLLCGDFNIAAGSEGYNLVVKANEYDDQFLAANSKGVFEKIFKVNDPHWQHYLADDYRIDYIFMNKNSALKVTSALVLFTDQDYGRVSDHCGYLMTFEPA